ncbi:MAG: tyrosinase family protein [Planctomycetaceae bacterium]|nr:tyrosinase family protein [Planctomycetaceae bacterium]
MEATRRGFLRVTTGAISGLSLAGPTTRALGGVQQRIRQRKDVSQLNSSSPDIVALTTAVGKMKAGLGDGDRRNWEAQAQIHGTFTGGFTHCQHGNWYFLPWHRGYLYFFEEIVRQLSGDEDFALPYWDWSKDFKLPATFWGNGNPLNDPARPGQPDSGRAVNQNSEILPRDQARFVNKSVISTILNQPDFETFAGVQANPGVMAGAGELEQTPHNFIHRWVGGDMVTGESPFDPIFWLHHCSVDRLWTEWVRKHPTSMPENDPAWTGTAFNDFCDRAGNPTTISVQQTLKTTDLGYQYALPASPVNSRPATAPARALEKSQGLRSVSPGQPGVGPEFRNGVAVYNYTPPGNQFEQFNQIIDNGIEVRKKIVRMRLQGIKIPSNQNVALQVHINCLLEKPDLPITDPSYVRSSTFFYPHIAKGQAGNAGHDTISFVMNVKPALGRLYGDRPLTSGEPLKVVVIAEPLFPNTDRASWRGEVQEVSPERVYFETVEAR